MKDGFWLIKNVLLIFLKIWLRAVVVFFQNYFMKNITSILLIFFIVSGRFICLMKSLIIGRLYRYLLFFVLSVYVCIHVHACMCVAESSSCCMRFGYRSFSSSKCILLKHVPAFCQPAPCYLMAEMAFFSLLCCWGWNAHSIALHIISHKDTLLILDPYLSSRKSAVRTPGPSTFRLMKN